MHDLLTKKLLPSSEHGSFISPLRTGLLSAPVFVNTEFAVQRTLIGHEDECGLFCTLIAQEHLAVAGYTTCIRFCQRKGLVLKLQLHRAFNHVKNTGR